MGLSTLTPRDTSSRPAARKIAQGWNDQRHAQPTATPRGAHAELRDPALVAKDEPGGCVATARDERRFRPEIIISGRPINPLLPAPTRKAGALAERGRVGGEERLGQLRRPMGQGDAGREGRLRQRLPQIAAQHIFGELLGEAVPRIEPGRRVGQPFRADLQAAVVASTPAGLLVLRQKRLPLRDAPAHQRRADAPAPVIGMHQTHDDRARRVVGRIRPDRSRGDQRASGIERGERRPRRGRQEPRPHKIRIRGERQAAIGRQARRGQPGQRALIFRPQRAPQEIRNS